MPQETTYLSPELRERLRGLGQTPAAHQSAGTWARQVLERFLLDLSWNSARLEGNTYSLLDTERTLQADVGATKGAQLSCVQVPAHLGWRMQTRSGVRSANVS